MLFTSADIYVCVSIVGMPKLCFMSNGIFSMYYKNSLRENCSCEYIIHHIFRWISPIAIMHILINKHNYTYLIFNIAGLGIGLRLVVRRRETAIDARHRESPSLRQMGVFFIARGTYLHHTCKWGKHIKLSSFSNWPAPCHHSPCGLIGLAFAYGGSDLMNGKYGSSSAFGPQ